MAPDNLHTKLRISIDRGGTFTDVYADYGGTEIVIKLLSEDPANYPDAPKEGIRRVLERLHELDSKAPADLSNIDHIRMGTTVATNALLERKGARTALLITKGFKDLLQIGYQNRPDLFDLKISKPEILYDQVIEIEERIRPAAEIDDQSSLIQGITGESYTILVKPDLSRIKEDLQHIKDQGITGIAIVLLHAYDCPGHELQIGALAKEMGFNQISLSSQVIPMIKVVPRGDTTVVDAYLTPHIRSYLNSFKSGFLERFSSKKLHFMQSDGGLSLAEEFRGSNAILSGPAGGVVGYAATTFNPEDGRAVIGFDMGGTSTDVSRFAGDFEIVNENQTAGVRIQSPQLQIHTVAAGGGSRLFFEHGMLSVGPESSGAHPGPVCYRKNGFLSITDANLLLGRIQADFFPQIFGLTKDMPLDEASVRIAFNKLTASINQFYVSKGKQLDIYETAAGCIEIANQTMARPIREISVMRGYDIKDHILATFGGAGGQHACAIAKMLGIREIFIHRHSGILSAYGIELADSAVERQQPASVKYTQKELPAIKAQLKTMGDLGAEELFSQGFTKNNLSFLYYLNMRYEGTDNSFMIRQPDDWNFEKAFHQRHIQEFGFDLSDRALLIDDYRVRVLGHGKDLKRQKISEHNPDIMPEKTASCYFNGDWHPTPVYLLDTLGSGFSIAGPALVVSDTATIVVEPQCSLKINDYGDITIQVNGKTTFTATDKVDPVQLAIFSNLFMSIAEQMGRTLQRTSISTNIKERLDFSCAIFDTAGRLVANAPHIPVHLGSMSFAVQEQIKLQAGNLKPGDVLVTNHPAYGGSHLPDITVITPVWQDNEIIFYTASRGHHADIGGVTPGSMPPFSKSLSEEGVCIDSFKLVENHFFQEQTIRSMLKGSRKIEDNISDLKAQVAANQKGIDLLLEMTGNYGLSTVHAYMQHIQDCAELSVREMLKSIADIHCTDKSELQAQDTMDDGTQICLKITINGKTGSATFDFNGTGPQVSGNWNTPKSVVFSTILYCLHSLSRTDIPLNHGCLKPIEVIIPENSLLSPSADAAVVGGNVLTSQRLTDVILKAFNACADSQGCMNNITFGNDSFGYYETIGGGAGAGPNWHGQSGVHTHMTNTRITDPEILEKRFPVMLREFTIREHSGGKGLYNGGNGLIREYEALTYLQTAVLTERRRYPPNGLMGGSNGKKGKNVYITKNQTETDLGGKNEQLLAPGERLRILTPGGGGFGKPANT